ncbi:MAG: RNA polymerase sigma factor [Myxococcota bacterium]
MAGASEVEELYRRYAPAVHRRAASLLRDDQEALDVTQATFLAFLESKERLRGEASHFTLLYQIATYQSLDRLRRRARWSNILGNLEVKEDDDGPSLLEPASDDGGARQVEAAHALSLLTKGEEPQTLTAATLYFVEGCTTEEIATVLDLSRKTVGKLLSQFAQRAQKRAQRFAPGVFA